MGIRIVLKSSPHQEFATRSFDIGNYPQELPFKVSTVAKIQNIDKTITLSGFISLSPFATRLIGVYTESLKDVGVVTRRRIVYEQKS